MINISGAFSKYNILIKFLILNKTNRIFINQRQVCVYDSFEHSPWNGGRIANLFDLSSPFEKIEAYNKYGIGVYITFSNYRIDDLYSKKENQLLEFLNQKTINGCIIGNSKLRVHIRSKYPNLKLIKSVTSFETTDLSKIDWDEVYEYDYFCPKFEWTFDERFYKNQDVSKAEVIVNSCCKRHCSLYKKHYDAIADANRLDITNKEELEKIVRCWWGDSDVNEVKPKLSGTNMTWDDLETAKTIGYINFKLSGREMSDELYFDDLKQYFSYLQNL